MKSARSNSAELTGLILWIFRRIADSQLLFSALQEENWKVDWAAPRPARVNLENKGGPRLLRPVLPFAAIWCPEQPSGRLDRHRLLWP